VPVPSCIPLRMTFADLGSFARLLTCGSTRRRPLCMTRSHTVGVHVWRSVCTLSVATTSHSVVHVIAPYPCPESLHPFTLKCRRVRCIFPRSTAVCTKNWVILLRIFCEGWRSARDQGEWGHIQMRSLNGGSIVCDSPCEASSSQFCLSGCSLTLPCEPFQCVAHPSTSSSCMYCRSMRCVRAICGAMLHVHGSLIV
jgi:hypothetical protein